MIGVELGVSGSEKLRNIYRMPPLALPPAISPTPRCQPHPSWRGGRTSAKHKSAPFRNLRLVVKNSQQARGRHGKPFHVCLENHATMSREAGLKMMWRWVRRSGGGRGGGWGLRLVAVAGFGAADRSVGSASARAAAPGSLAGLPRSNGVGEGDRLPASVLRAEATTRPTTRLFQSIP
jgi:hypothetical protein